MIIDIKGLIQKILKRRSVEKNALEYDMVFDANTGCFTPRVTQNAKSITILAEHDEGELVGMAIVDKPFNVNGKIAVLTSTGLFVDVNLTRSTDIMLFSSYADALNTIEELKNFTTTKKQLGYLTVFAAYQKDRDINLTFVELRR